jgi:hypothetical protein
MDRTYKIMPWYWTTLPFWLAVFLNILVISIFETVFYFCYATRIEKEVLLSDIGRYTNLLARQIQHSTNASQKENIINGIRRTANVLKTQEKASALRHEKHKHQLFMKAFMYESAIFALVVVVLATSVIRWYVMHNGNMDGWFASLRLGHILTELIFVLLLYMAFDFLYVNFVMKKWQSMRATDFQKNIIRGSRAQDRTLPSLQRRFETIEQVMAHFREKGGTCAYTHP